MSINRVNISGNLTRDPELRSTAGGTQILSFGIAVNDRRRNQQTGEWEDVPNFVDCVVFGQRAEALSRFLSKGSKVAAPGRRRKDNVAANLRLLLMRLSSFLGISRAEPLCHRVRHLMQLQLHRHPLPFRLRQTRSSTMLIFRFKRQTATKLLLSSER